jgi:translation elongation factor EF-G
MRKIMEIIFIILIFMETLSSFEIDPYPKNASLTEIFSINCLQMTQSQQMLKAYVMIGVKSNFQNPQKHLTKAIGDYDKRMYQVRKYFHKHLKKKSHKSAKESFDEALELWKINKKMLAMEPTQENVVIIQKNFLLMIDKLLEGTKPIATPELELISLTGKLCRKPMEVTIDYLIRMWGVEVEDYEKNIERTITKYHANLKILSLNELNNAESLNLLKKAKNEFKFFEFMYKSKTKFIPSLLSKKADDNFLIIRGIKQVYKKQAS